MMFAYTVAFDQPIGEWDTSNGATYGMFSGATLMLGKFNNCPEDGPPSSCFNVAVGTFP